jgi:hypothetical protein
MEGTDMEVTLKLNKKAYGSVTLEANSYYLFTFHTDGSVFAHSDINPQVTGVKVTKKAQRVKLEK